MSGPIVRKYGFPNHEAIFGKKEIEHGVEAEAGGRSSGPTTASEGAETAAAPKKKAAPRKAKKKGE